MVGWPTSTLEAFTLVVPMEAAAGEHQSPTGSASGQENELPRVLMLAPPAMYAVFHAELSKSFNFIKPYESPLPTDQFLSAYAADVTALLSRGGEPRITADVLRLLPSLKCIVTTSAGLDHVDLAECRRRDIAVVNASNVFSEDVADAAFGLLIDVLRKISAGDRYVRDGAWSGGGSFGLGRKLTGKRVGIVGLGSIGSKVATRLEAFGCKIFYSSRKLKPSVSYEYCPDAYQLAEKVDILVICCALTDQTRHMVNKEVFTKLGKDGVIVNIARGGIIDEKELVRCLVENEIAGAGLDVFEHEPSVPKELYALENVVLSPHQAAFTLESCRDLYEHVTGNLKAFFSRKPLLSSYVDD